MTLYANQCVLYLSINNIFKAFCLKIRYLDNVLIIKLIIKTYLQALHFYFFYVAFFVNWVQKNLNGYAFFRAPGVYASVAYFLDWISETINNYEEGRETILATKL